MPATPILILETLLAATGDATIGFFTGALFGEVAFGGNAAAAIAVTSAGLNGLLGGIRRTYGWRQLSGWVAFLLDSSWALLSTTFGNLVNLLNLVGRDSGYHEGLSKRQHRHVYERGFTLKAGFANALGCVISNVGRARPTSTESQRALVDQHENLHVW